MLPAHVVPPGQLIAGPKYLRLQQSASGSKAATFGMGLVGHDEIIGGDVSWMLADDHRQTISLASCAGACVSIVDAIEFARGI